MKLFILTSLVTEQDSESKAILLDVQDLPEGIVLRELEDVVLLKETEQDGHPEENGQQDDGQQNGQEDKKDTEDNGEEQSPETEETEEIPLKSNGAEEVSCTAGPPFESE